MAAIIRSGASTDQLTIDATSKAARTTLYDAAGRVVVPQSKATFFAANTFTPAATPTDLITIYGSASKTVRVVSFRIGTNNTAAGSQTFFLLKRSAVNTAGTFVPGTAVQADSADAAATATVGHYTANPSGLGTLVGNINIKRVASPVLVPATYAGIVQYAGFEMIEVPASLEKQLTLNGVAQGVCLNFNGAALVAGQIHFYQVVWTEE